MRPVQNVFQKLSRTEQRREGVAAYLWSLAYTQYTEPDTDNLGLFLGVLVHPLPYFQSPVRVCFLIASWRIFFFIYLLATQGSLNQVHLMFKTGHGRFVMH